MQIAVKFGPHLNASSSSLLTDTTKEMHKLKVGKTMNSTDSLAVVEFIAWMDGHLLAMLLIIIDNADNVIEEDAPNADNPIKIAHCI